ncbi:hypothetical protein [uncultured Desulfosarcina sp.]|uniref:hypothetical protein n=1 Tax=uncultured Desulfosarcina sp. TaxID=218289 RepID=UPI0029C8C937|nr:hypothetical protein [uncultured Desulfosarcina sp.]
MQRLLCALFIGSLLYGCGTHYYRTDGSNTTLILIKPEAEQVILACSLDGFSPRPAKKVAGYWEVTLPANESFKYFYRVDGELFLPDCPMKENDDFGSKTCIYDPQM